MSKSKKGGSRYDKVKEALNSIQGNTIPDYQGYHAFWLSIEIFETIELYGQRMISPPDDDDSHGAQPGGPAEGCCGGKGDGEAADDEDGGSAVEAVTTWPKGHNNPDCWPSGGPGGGGGSGSGGRSARSGIIIGLKGEAPFDGSEFPPLLWGKTARRATEAEIQLIADWIDDGCPAEDEESESPQVASRIAISQDAKRAMATGERKVPVSQACTNIDCKEVKGLSIRKEISTLTAVELDRLKRAIECMFQYDDFWQDDRSFKYWARIHTDSCQHGWEQFLPWHRAYLYFFEQKLQDFDEHITLPYWAWTDYADENMATFDNLQPDLGIIPVPYRCFLTSAAVDKLARVRSADKDGPLFSKSELERLNQIAIDQLNFNSGLRLLAKAEIPYSLIKDPETDTAAWSQKIRVLYDALLDINPLWFPNRWPGMAGGPANYPAKPDIQNILELSAWADFGGGPDYDHHFGALEQVHNGMHNFSGGANPAFPGPKNKKWNDIYKKLGLDPASADQQNKENPPGGWMTDNRITAFDPMFWGHHSNVDRIWALWQERHAGSPEGLDGVLAPWSMTVKDTLSVRRLGYEYQRDTFYYRMAGDMAVTRFSSEMAGAPSDVLDLFRKAEIRLHRVRRGNLPNAAIHLFLNTPGANEKTPTMNNDHYVGTVNTFHGSCYGGPGHCDLPLDKTRPMDQRQLNHHEPRNYRIDATETARRLLNNGEEDLSVQLVVIGLDGQPQDNALFIDGVSLNFLD